MQLDCKFGGLFVGGQGPCWLGYGGGSADGGKVVAYRGPGAAANPTPSVVITILRGIDRDRTKSKTLPIGKHSSILKHL